jgi:tetratricopeptide (TPR) repeat protein
MARISGLYVLSGWFGCLLCLVIFGACTNNNESESTIGKPVDILIEQEDSTFSVLADAYNENPDSAIFLAKSCESKMKARGNYRGLTRLYSFMSELYQYRINNDYKALEYINKAINVLAEHPSTHFDNPFLYINAGNILYQYEMYHEAIYLYKEIDKVIDLDKRAEVIPLISNNIGLAYQGMNRCDSARQYFRHALRQVDTTDSHALLIKIQTYNHLSALALQCEYKDSVPLYFRHTERLFADLNKQLDKGADRKTGIRWKDIALDYLNYRIAASLNMADYHLRSNQPDAALRVIRQPHPHVSPNATSDVMHAKLAEAYLQKKEFERALNHTDTALMLFGSSGGDYDVKAAFYQLRYTILKQAGNEKAAAAAYDMAEQWIDSADSQKTSHDVMSGKIELAVKPIQFAMKKIEIRKNQQLKTIQMKLRLAEQEKKISLYRWLTISGALFISLLVLIFVVYRYKSKKRLAEVSLEASEKEKKFMTNELQDFSLHLVYRNDFLVELQHKLKALLKDASDENRQKIKELRLQISQNLQSGHDAQMIEEKINEINSGFLFNLSEKFPHLTENDKNLCALVRMNLSSKEIASIKNISERSVITARYRLRQKLNLDSDQNLNDFLKQL